MSTERSMAALYDTLSLKSYRRHIVGFDVGQHIIMCLPGLIYNACQLEFASILKHQHFEASLQF